MLFRCKKLRSRRRTAGFSLTESVIVVAIFTILMLAISNAATFMYRVNGYTIAQAYQVDYARRGVTLMVRDIREMIFSDNGSFPLVVMEPHRMGFYSDIDRDASVEYVEYGYNTASTTLEKQIYNAVGTPPTYDLDTPDEVIILSEFVQNFAQATSTFRYFNSAGVELTSSGDITDVRYVEVRVIVNIDPVRDPGQFMLRESATIRNLFIP